MSIGLHLTANADALQRALDSSRPLARMAEAEAQTEDARQLLARAAREVELEAEWLKTEAEAAAVDRGRTPVAAAADRGRTPVRRSRGRTPFRSARGVAIVEEAELWPDAMPGAQGLWGQDVLPDDDTHAASSVDVRAIVAEGLLSGDPSTVDALSAAAIAVQRRPSRTVAALERVGESPPARATTPRAGATVALQITIRADGGDRDRGSAEVARLARQLDEFKAESGARLERQLGELEALLRAGAAGAAEREHALQMELVAAAEAAERAELAVQAVREGAQANSSGAIASLQALRVQVGLARDDAERTAAELVEAREDVEDMRVQLVSLERDKPRRDALLADELKLRARAMALAEAHDEITLLRAKLALRSSGFGGGGNGGGGFEVGGDSSFGEGSFGGGGGELRALAGKATGGRRRGDFGGGGGSGFGGEGGSSFGGGGGGGRDRGDFGGGFGVGGESSFGGGGGNSFGGFGGGGVAHAKSRSARRSEPVRAAAAAAPTRSQTIPQQNSVPLPQEVVDLAVQVVRKERAVRARAAELNGRKLEASHNLTAVRRQLAALPPVVSRGALLHPQLASLRQMEQRYTRQVEAWEAKKAGILAERERALEAALSAMSIIVAYGKPGDNTKVLSSRLRLQSPAQSRASGRGAGGGATRVAASVNVVRLGTRLDANPLSQRGWAVPIVLARGDGDGSGGRGDWGAPALSNADALGVWASSSAGIEEVLTPGGKHRALPPIGRFDVELMLPGGASDSQLGLPGRSRSTRLSSRSHSASASAIPLGIQSLFVAPRDGPSPLRRSSFAFAKHSSQQSSAPRLHLSVLRSPGPPP
ncbi:hypothetical protein T492DRAFT_113384 [Pavlovales sp. CCMP2436]|nr:hypothetical protein T492DRAFT_113384 [Pavlovales sp. CCMP2436]